MRRHSIPIYIIILLALFFFGFGCTTINMNNYNGYAYQPAPDYFPKQLQSVIGNENGYKIYSLANDPDHLFLYPKNGLKLPRNLLAREDVVLPLPSMSSVECIEIITKEGNTIVLDGETQNYIIDVFSGKYESILEETMFDSVYDIRIYFTEYPQIYYQKKVFKNGLDYGLRMEDGKTIALLDNEKLHTWFDRGCQD